MQLPFVNPRLQFPEVIVRNNIVFTYDRSFPSKAQAEQEVRYARRDGYYSRVIYSTKIQRYGVYLARKA